MAPQKTKSRISAIVREKWKHFERLVAAIHQAADAGADVRWDEQIDGRQFDVTIRFRKGLYDHLSVVECKEYKQPVPIEKVEAFVTKSRDVHANVAVLASSSGFQSGAMECAKRHGITLLHVTAGGLIDPSVFGAKWGESKEVLVIKSISLRYADGSEKTLPSRQNVLTYYAYHIVLERTGVRRTLDSVISAVITKASPKEENHTELIPVEDGTSVVEPTDDEIPLKPLKSIEVETAIVTAKAIEGPYRVDPVVLLPRVDVKNVTTGESTSFDYGQLPLGIGNKFTPGKFYESQGLGFFHYCNWVKGDLVELWMVESFQFGQLFQCRVTLETKYANRYVEVTDEAVLSRLERRRKSME